MHINIANEKTAEKIDIPSIYEAVRKAYGDMGYPISGDRLVVSGQPTYSDGRPVPKEVMSPNASGGNTQDDGTVVINPAYRKVMRHWKLKGSGRDFLETIIGHELGHHIDRTLFRHSSSDERRKKLLDEIRSRKFHTVYTDSYDPKTTDPRKLDKELLAEYLSSLVREKLHRRWRISPDPRWKRDEHYEDRLTHMRKDEDKFNQLGGITRMIAFGRPGSVTDRYAREVFKDIAVKGDGKTQYSPKDVVGLSVNGGTNKDNVRPTDRRFVLELLNAIKARATIVGDDLANRTREHNLPGEGELARFIAAHGYSDDNGNGVWRPDDLR